MTLLYACIFNRRSGLFQILFYRLVSIFFSKIQLHETNEKLIIIFLLLFFTLFVVKTQYLNIVINLYTFSVIRSILFSKPQQISLELNIKNSDFESFKKSPIIMHTSATLNAILKYINTYLKEKKLQVPYTFKKVSVNIRCIFCKKKIQM